MVGTKVRLKGAIDTTEGKIFGHLDELVRVRWADGLCGIYWLGQLEVL